MPQFAQTTGEAAFSETKSIVAFDIHLQMYDLLSIQAKKIVPLGTAYKNKTLFGLATFSLQHYVVSTYDCHDR